MPDPFTQLQETSLSHTKKSQALKTTITPTNFSRKKMSKFILLPMPTTTTTATTTLNLSILFLHTLFTICNAGSALDLNSLQNTEIDAIVTGGCSNKIGECFEEPEMESEISRRVLLMHKKYISYETLRRDMVPCDKPGASYYECNARQANPYSRGCEVITRCARSIGDINN